MLITNLVIKLAIKGVTKMAYIRQKVNTYKGKVYKYYQLVEWRNGKLVVLQHLGKDPTACRQALKEGIELADILRHSPHLSATLGTAKNRLYASEHNEALKKALNPIPVGDVYYADPPWKYDFSETITREIENQYPTMELADIKELIIPAPTDSALFLWATAPKLREALEVMSAWGYQYKTNAVWDKRKIGMGYWFRGQHELLLIGTRGNMPPPEQGNRQSSVIAIPRTGHSIKPPEAHNMIEQMLPDLQYVELFARKPYNERWLVWGNEVEVETGSH